jgi:hypothetical protein
MQTVYDGSRSRSARPGIEGVSRLPPALDFSVTTLKASASNPNTHTRLLWNQGEHQQAFSLVPLGHRKNPALRRGFLQITNRASGSFILLLRILFLLFLLFFFAFHLP